MIRNNKQNVTDLKGNRLFHPPVVTNLEFRFSPEERDFYEMLTDFIRVRTSLCLLARRDHRQSRPTGACRHAEAGFKFGGRHSPCAPGQTGADRGGEEAVGRVAGAARADSRLRQTRLITKSSRSKATSMPSAGWKRKSRSYPANFKLMENEEPRLRELVAAADKVRRETKIDKIVSILHNEFAGRQVLFFTEYKATQSLLMSALMREFGEGVRNLHQWRRPRRRGGHSHRVKLKALRCTRSDATDQFNAGQVRFLVSTEAGGEGIDLQESCHSLVHVDLPWNPMRLHQRVGRLNRYGQKKQVEVIVLRNPETVEGRIWEILQEKMNEIMLALGHAMDEPEDFLQLVLGMTIAQACGASCSSRLPSAEGVLGPVVQPPDRPVRERGRDQDSAGFGWQLREVRLPGNLGRASQDRHSCIAPLLFINAENQSPTGRRKRRRPCVPHAGSLADRTGNLSHLPGNGFSKRGSGP